MVAFSKPLESVLIKPAGPDCNMACTYCFYLEKANLFNQAKIHRMGEDVLREMVKQVMRQSGPQVSFGWQGGEPTLMGLPFFQRAVDFQMEYGYGKTVGNGLQTNGLLIDKEWARFLKKYNFLVGLSLDGPEHIHDRYRRTRGGKGTWNRVLDSAKLMLDVGVEVNALIVVNDYSVQFPEEIYQFHKELGLTHMQFIPCVEKIPGTPSDLAPFTVPAKAYGEFLCKLFDLWMDNFVDGRPTTSIRFFDSLFYHYVGLAPPDCTLLRECGVYVVVEHNGDIYACDFYVEPEWRLGNIMKDDLIDLLNSPKQREFGRVKSQLPPECLQCSWLKYCWGGCPRERIAGAKGRFHNHLCEAYKMFFDHADSKLQKLAEEWKTQQAKAPTKVEPAPYSKREHQEIGAKVGRNDPCPCGSGLKYKKCCGR